MIVCEIRLKTRTDKTPNCSNCNSSTPYLFWSENELGQKFLGWRKCPNDMTDEERQAVRNLYV